VTDTDIIPRPGWRAWLGFTWGLARATVFYALHPRSPLPGDCGHVIMSIRVPRSARGSRLAALAAIADGLRVAEEPAELDCMVARRRWGRVSVMATVQGPGYTAELARLSAPAHATGSAA
jgi:hypothetical protein